MCKGIPYLFINIHVRWRNWTKIDWFQSILWKVLESSYWFIYLYRLPVPLVLEFLPVTLPSVYCFTLQINANFIHLACLLIILNVLKIGLRGAWFVWRGIKVHLRPLKTLWTFSKYKGIHFDSESRAGV